MIGEYLNGALNDIKTSVHDAIITGLRDAFTHFLSWLGTAIIASSYWICLFICIVALFLYMSGHKKYGKYVGLSFLVYFILQCIKVAI